MPAVPVQPAQPAPTPARTPTAPKELAPTSTPTPAAPMKAAPTPAPTPAAPTEPASPQAAMEDDFEAQIEAEKQKTFQRVKAAKEAEEAKAKAGG